jgi:hypothetical protein
MDLADQLDRIDELATARTVGAYASPELIARIRSFIEE